jgi:hypothetical protein
MRDQEIIGLWEAYNQVYELDEEKVELKQRNKNEMQRKAGNLGREVVSSKKGPKRTAAMNRMGKLVSSIARDDEEKRFKTLGQSPAHNEQVDLYDIILSHLIEEGYAESVEQAEVIMVNMSEDWRESIVEGIGSLLLKGGKALLPKLKNIGSIFKKVELPSVKAPMSANAQRSAQLRAKYNIGPERSDTSAKRQILDRSRDNATRAQTEVDRGNASPSYYNKAKDASDRYQNAGGSKYGATNDAAGRRTLGGRGSTGTPDPSGPGSYHPSAGRPPGDRGSGSKAFAKAQKLNPELTYTEYSKALNKSSKKPSMVFNNSYEHDVFDTILEYLVVEGYADTNENAIVIMTNMSEDWRESIVEMNNLPSGGKTPAMKYETGKSGGTMRYETGKSTGKSVYKKGPDGRPSPYQPL